MNPAKEIRDPAPNPTLTRDEIILYEQLALKRLRELRAPRAARTWWMRAVDVVAWMFKEPAVPLDRAPGCAPCEGTRPARNDNRPLCR